MEDRIQIVGVGLLTYVWLPWLARVFRSWLDPVDGGGLRRTLLGAAIVVGVNLAALALFLSVRSLQFWDHAG